MIDETETLESPDVVELPRDEAPAKIETKVEREPARDDNSDVETRARAMGWVGKEEYRGPADNWRDASEFVKRGEEELPILRERNRDMARKLNEIETRQRQSEEKYQQEIRRLDAMSTQALQRQREQLYASFEAQKLEAVRVGDEQRYQQLNRDQYQAVSEYDRGIESAKPKPTDTPRQPPPEVSEWVQQNAWFNSDPELNAVAQQAHMRLNETKPGLSLKENLAEVTSYVRSRYPEKFGRSDRPTAVESGGGRGTASAQRSKGVTELPADAKRQGEKFVKEGLYKNIAEYAADYHAQG